MNATQNGGRAPLDFADINRHALPRLEAILCRLNIEFRPAGHELQMKNPARMDRHFGSMSVNRRTGKWMDFATGDGGGDVVSLWAFARHINQVEAAHELSAMLGVSSCRTL